MPVFVSVVLHSTEKIVSNGLKDKFGAVGGYVAGGVNLLIEEEVVTKGVAEKAANEIKNSFKEKNITAQVDTPFLRDTVFVLRIRLTDIRPKSLVQDYCAPWGMNLFAACVSTCRAESVLSSAIEFKLFQDMPTKMADALHKYKVKSTIYTFQTQAEQEQFLVNDMNFSKYDSFFVQLIVFTQLFFFC